MNIRPLGVGDDAAVAGAEHLFDRRVDAEATARFLADPNHHLLLAYDSDERPVGFVSGVETTHPDKGTEMFLYELAVDEPARRQGIGRALVEALAVLARERGCYGMFVLTDEDNVAALATYRSAGGGKASPNLMLEWDFRASS
jgi:ribosomal protein S18 acetylase RimI-like enzyme